MSHPPSSSSSASSPTVEPQPTGEVSHWPHRVAWVLVAVTFPLLWVGGLVTTTKAGMAVPDWPGTYGYNLFLYPWRSWLFGPWDLFIEHGHRLLASLAGVLTIVLAILLARKDPRRWMHALGWLALLAVIVQGVLGGFRVMENARLLAMIHGCSGPLFFSLTVALVVTTSAWWRQASSWRQSITTESSSSLRWFALAAVGSTYLQLIFGAQLRHPTEWTTPAAFAETVWHHLYTAALVALLTLMVGWLATRRGTPSAIRRPAMLAVVVLFLQISLGATTWIAKYNVPQWMEHWLGLSPTTIVADSWWQTHVVTAHQATGCLLLALLLTTTLYAFRYALAGSYCGAACHQMGGSLS